MASPSEHETGRDGCMTPRRLPVMTATADKRFWGKVERRDNHECWPWTGSIGSNGYGNFFYQGRVISAHRFSYELNVGPIPEGLQIDHVAKRGCTMTICVNPAHLEPVTPRENTMRAPRSQATINASRTHCPHGHPYDIENTRITKTGARLCLTCQRTRKRGKPRSQTILAV